jgi:hypothetical protein
MLQPSRQGELPETRERRRGPPHRREAKPGVRAQLWRTLSQLEKDRFGAVASAINQVVSKRLVKKQQPGVCVC